MRSGDLGVVHLVLVDPSKPLGVQEYSVTELPVHIHILSFAPHPNTCVYEEWCEGMTADGPRVHAFVDFPTENLDELLADFFVCSLRFVRQLIKNDC